MIRDRLTRAERIRLEALAQANAHLALCPPARDHADPTERLVAIAGRLEDFIRHGSEARTWA